MFKKKTRRSRDEPPFISVMYIYGSVPRDYCCLEHHHQKFAVIFIIVFLVDVLIRVQSYIISFNLQTFLREIYSNRYFFLLVGAHNVKN